MTWRTGSAVVEPRIDGCGAVPDRAVKVFDALSLNSLGAAEAESLDSGTRALVARRARVMGPSYRLHYARPVNPVRAAGTRIWDASGEVLLDAYNNVPSVGHGNPRVIEAVTAQLATVSTNTRYLQEPVVRFAEDLVSTFDPALGRVMFTCTGSEANDLAIRIARHVTGNTGIIVTEYAYHGATAEVASWSPSSGSAVPLGRDVRVVPPPERLRCSGSSPAEVFRDRVAAAMDDLHRHGVGVAALVVDSLFSSDGIHIEAPASLGPVVDLVHNAGGLFVADEVQAGYGRTGAALWGHQWANVLPDLATMGKPMGNGLPIAAVVARPDLLDVFGSMVPYFNTFGANTACVAAAQAVLDIIREDGLVESARTQGDRLLAGVREIMSSWPSGWDVRGTGLYVGVEFFEPDAEMTPDAAVASEFVNGMREAGVLISIAGPYGNVLKIRPPLTFDAADTATFLGAYEKVTAQLSRTAARR